MPLNTFSMPTEISNNDAESRENTGAEKWRSAASSISKENDLPNGPVSVPQVTDYLHVLKTSVTKTIPSIRIGRLPYVKKDEIDDTPHAMGSDI